MPAAGIPCPVAVMTGALGAGKTTLVNALLRDRALAGTAVVVNEFGSVGIDNELIESATEEVVLLPGGCVCCQVRADLAEALLRLERGVRRGELPAFRRVVVETSGLAEPGPILQLFAESPLLRGRFRMEALIAVVDGRLGRAALQDERSPASRQVLLADRLILSKIELAAPDELRALEACLSALNPHADRVRAPRQAADPGWLAPPALPQPRAVPPASLRAAHDEAIASFVLHWSDAQPLETLGEWLHRLAESFGERLLRVKGIVAACESPQPVAVHAIQHLVSPPDFLDGRACASRVVFITRGLEPDDVRPPWPVSVGR